MLYMWIYIYFSIFFYIYHTNWPRFSVVMVFMLYSFCIHPVSAVYSIHTVADAVCQEAARHQIGCQLPRSKWRLITYSPLINSFV